MQLVPLDAAGIQAYFDASPFIAFMGLEVQALDAQARELSVRAPMRAEWQRLPDVRRWHGGPIAAVIDTGGGLRAGASRGQAAADRELPGRLPASGHRHRPRRRRPGAPARRQPWHRRCGCLHRMVGSGVAAPLRRDWRIDANAERRCGSGEARVPISEQVLCSACAPSRIRRHAQAWAETKTPSRRVGSSVSSLPWTTQIGPRRRVETTWNSDSKSGATMCKT